jgi:cobalt-zinc-cadmium efflux system protein
VHARNESRVAWAALLTGGFMLVEAAGGLLSGSLALLADAGHMFTDVLGLGMALLAIRFAQRPATPSKTYGFYRTEILAATANSVILFAIAAYILYEAWRRFQEPPEINSLPMLAVATGGLIVNLIGAKLLHGGSGESLNVQGAFLEVISDLVGSLGVIIAGAIIYFTGWWQADPIVSVGIGLFILPRTWKLLKSALDVLLEATPSHINLTELEAAMCAVLGVTSVHDLHAWTITSGFIAMSGHVLADGRPSAEVLHELRVLLRERFGIEHATLQVEATDHADDGACCMLDPRCLVVGGPPAGVAPQSAR